MKISVNELGALSTFKGLSEKELDWFLECAEVRRLSNGEKLFSKGEPAEYMLLVFSGKLDLYQETEGQRKLLASLGPGQITGLLPYSGMKSIAGEAIALEETVVLALHREHFQEMEKVSQEMVHRLVALMTRRVREFTRVQEQQEKLESLGKLAAGLAHELNNPAAAIKRTASGLLKRIEEQYALLSLLAGQQIDAKLLQEVSELVKKWETRQGEGQSRNSGLSMMEHSEQENELAEWLEKQQVNDSLQLAESFLDCGIMQKDLEQLKSIIPEKHLPAMLAWLENNLTAGKLIREIEEASGRISELVDSVKGYSHMDNSPDMQLTDIHNGINSTLVMLGHKLKKKNIKLDKKYQQNFPQIHAYAGELNQVWTNILDNAIDAVEPGGKITVETSFEAEHVKVKINDNGPGIPAEVISRIFDPFFTTKEVGQGSGLGLDIVRRIITTHHGDIRVESVPGKTDFILSFPVNPPQLSG